MLQVEGFIPCIRQSLTYVNGLVAGLLLGLGGRTVWPSATFDNSKVLGRPGTFAYVLYLIGRRSSLVMCLPVCSRMRCHLSMTRLS